MENAPSVWGTIIHHSVMTDIKEVINAIVGGIFTYPLNSSNSHKLTYQNWTIGTTLGIHISIFEFYDWTP